MINHLKIINRASSSSDLARNAVLSNNNNFNAFYVKEQTHGRGRNNKHWFSPKGNLHLSVIMKTKKPIYFWNEISIIASVAVRKSIIDISHIFKENLKFKWPNDLVISNKKVGGILIETFHKEDSVIIGIGLNLIYNPPESKNSWPVGNFSNFFGNKIDPIILSNLITINISEAFIEWEKEGFNKILYEWKDHLCYLGEYLHSFDLKKKYSGYFDSVGEKGQMILRTDKNKLIEFYSGTFVPRFLMDYYVIGD